MGQKGNVWITWLGHATFKITSAAGKTVLIDPWIEGNPATPAGLKKLDRIDVMLITHGHFDHIGDAVSLAFAHGPAVVCNWETSVWLESKGVRRITGMNKGGTVEVAGMKVTMVHADHSCGILDEGRVVYGGDPCGYVVELENGYRIYHAGDTNVFGDMALIGELCSPDLALLPIGGHYTMGPAGAARACRLLGVPAVIPMHFGTFPVLEGTPAELKAATRDIQGLQIVELTPGEAY